MVLFFTVIKSATSSIGWGLQIYFSLVAGINPSNLIMLEEINAQCPSGSGKNW
jgi:hypothetical protein